MLLIRAKSTAHTSCICPPGFTTRLTSSQCLNLRPMRSYIVTLICSESSLRGSLDGPPMIGTSAARSVLFQRLTAYVCVSPLLTAQVFLDYVHAMTRMPELREYLDDVDAVPDPVYAAEVEELTRSVPKMITLLPDILRDRSDIRHNAALAEMISGLTLRLDQLRPLAVRVSRASDVEPCCLHSLLSSSEPICVRQRWEKQRSCTISALRRMRNSYGPLKLLSHAAYTKLL